jgi:hypothetical protein
MTAKKGYNSSLITQLSTLWYVGFQSFFFLSYYFLEFDELVFSFHDTYDSRFKGRYKKDLLTYLDIDLDLWSKARSFGGLDRNWVYRHFNITAKNLQMTCSALTVECSQSIPSIQTTKFTTILDQWL